MKKLLLTATLLVLLLALALPGTAFAGGLRQDRVIFGENFTLRSDEILDGNLIVFGGNVILEAGSQLQGDVVVFGGNLDAAGQIEGSLVCLGGSVILQSGSLTREDVVLVGGELQRQPGADIQGEVLSDLRAPFSFAFGNAGQLPRFDVQFSPVLNILRFFLMVFLWAGLAVLVLLFLPAHTARVAQTVVSQPLVAGGLGLLTVVVLPPILLLLAITILLAPVALVVAAIAALAWAYGLVAIGYELGKRLASSLHQDWAPALAAGLGTLLLILVINGVRELVPCIGWILPFLAGVFGLGAVLLTRFGMQSYPALLETAAPLAPRMPPAAPAPAVTPEPPAPPEEPQI